MKDRLFRSINPFWKERHGERIQKVSLDAGFTCPNRDGTKAVGGCIYCNNESFNFSPRASLHEQLRKGIVHAKRRYGGRKFLAYFQAYSNTYAPASKLYDIYSTIYDFPEVVGMSVGTRPDCVPEEALQVLERFTSTHEVWVEYGLESSNDDTLRRINRAHTFADFKDAVQRTAGRGLRIAAHVIAGFPWEDEATMMKTAQDIASLPIDAVKIHNLHIVRGTALETMHRRNALRLFTMEQYASVAARMLELLSPEMLILRLTADCPASMLVAPDWCNRKKEIVASIEKELLLLNSRQGERYGQRPRQLSLPSAV